MFALSSFTLALSTFSVVQALSATYSSAYGVIPSVVEIWEPDITVTEHYTTTVRKECSDCQTGAPQQVTSSVSEAWSLPTTPPVTTTLVPTTHWSHDASDPQILVPDHAVQIYYAPSGDGDWSKPHQFQWINATLSKPAIHLDQTQFVTYTWFPAANTLSVQFSTKEAFDIAKSSWSDSNILIAHVEGCGDYDKGDSCYIHIDTLSFGSTSLSCQVTGEPLGFKDSYTSMKASWGKYTPPEQYLRPAFDPNFSANAMSVFSSVMSKYVTTPTGASPTYNPYFGGKPLFAKPSGWDYIPAGAAYDVHAQNDSSNWSAWGYSSRPGRPYGGWTGTGTSTTTTSTVTSITTTSTASGCTFSSVVSSLSSMFSSMAVNNGNGIGGASQCNGLSYNNGDFHGNPPINGIDSSTGTNFSNNSDSGSSDGTSSPDGTGPSNDSGSSGGKGSSSGPTYSNSTDSSSGNSVSNGTSSSSNSGINGKHGPSNSTDGSTDIGSSNGANPSNTTQSGGSFNNSGASAGSNSTTGANNSDSVDSGTNSGTVVNKNSTSNSNHTTGTSSSNSTQVGINSTSTLHESNCTRGVDPRFGLPTTCIGPAFDLDLDSIDGFLTLEQTEFAAIIDLFPGLITESVLAKVKRSAGLIKRGCSSWDLVCKAREAAEAAYQAAQQAAAAAAKEAEKIAKAAADAAAEAQRKLDEEARALAAEVAAAQEAARIALENATAEAKRLAEQAEAEAKRRAEEAARVAQAAVDEAKRLAEEATAAAAAAAQAVADGIVAAAEATGQGISDAAAKVIADIVEGLSGSVGFDLSVPVPINIDLAALGLDLIQTTWWGAQPPLLKLQTVNTDGDAVDHDYAAEANDDQGGKSASIKAGLWLYCVDCVITGSVELEGALEVSLGGIEKLMVGFNADMDISLGLGIEANAIIAYTYRKELFRQGIPNLCAGTTLCVGPYIALAAELAISAEAKGHLLVGGKWNIDSASAELWAYGDGASNSRGWTPSYEKRLEVGGTITVGAGISLPLSVGCGITILDGLWSKNAELAIVPTLDATATVGGHIDLETGETDTKTDSGCNGLDLSLDWNIRLKYNIFDLLSAQLWELGPQNLAAMCLPFSDGSDDKTSSSGSSSGNNSTDTSSGSGSSGSGSTSSSGSNNTDTTSSSGSGNNSTDSTIHINNNSTKTTYEDPSLGTNSSHSPIGPIVNKVKIIDKSDLMPLLICNGNVYKQEPGLDSLTSHPDCTSDWYAYNNAPVGAVNVASVSGVGSIVTDASLRIAVINQKALTKTGVSRLRLVDSTQIPSQSEYIVFDWIHRGWAGVDRFGHMYQAVQCKNLNATTAGVADGLSQVFMVWRDLPEQGLDNMALDRVVYSISNGQVKECQQMELQWALS